MIIRLLDRGQGRLPRERRGRCAATYSPLLRAEKLAGFSGPAALRCDHSDASKPVSKGGSIGLTMW